MNGEPKEAKPRVKHTVNGDEFNGWYCYVCAFFSRNVEEAAKHDGLIEQGERDV